VVGDTENAVRDDLGVRAADEAGRDPGLHVGQGVGDRLFLSSPDQRSEPLLGACELQEHEEVPVVVEPSDGRADPHLDPAHRVRLVGDRLTLRAAKLSLCVGQDLAEKLLLGLEVPIEDAFADPEAVDDVRDRRRVVPEGGEAPSSEVDQLPASPLSSRCEPPRHRVDAIRRLSPGATVGEVAYWLLKGLLSPIFRLLWRVKVEGAEHVPVRGPVILAPNHVTFLDSMFLPLVVRRRVTFVAKAEYFDSWKTAWFFRAAGQIPMRREGGSASERALAVAREVLKSGGVLGIYPEGTRSPDGRLYRGHTGVARLALGCQVPLVPVGMCGTGEVQRPGSNRPRPFKKVVVRFGNPINLSRFEGGSESDPMALRSLTDELMFEIRALSGQQYADHYAKKHGVVGGSEIARLEQASSNGGDSPRSEAIAVVTAHATSLTTL